MIQIDRTTFNGLGEARIEPTQLFHGALGHDGETHLTFDDWTRTPAGIVWRVLATASMAASVYHGYKRNDSIGWAIGWGFMGALFPVITPVVAVAQGFAKPKKR